MTHNSRKKNGYKNYDETERTQIKTGYDQNEFLVYIQSCTLNI